MRSAAYIVSNGWDCKAKLLSLTHLVKHASEAFEIEVVCSEPTLERLQSLQHLAVGLRAGSRYDGNPRSGVTGRRSAQYNLGCVASTKVAGNREGQARESFQDRRFPTGLIPDHDELPNTSVNGKVPRGSIINITLPEGGRHSR